MLFDNLATMLLNGVNFFSLTNYLYTPIQNDFNYFSSQPALYLLYNNNGNLIYIGKTDNLRKRTLQHFSHLEKNIVIKNEAVYVYYLITETVEKAALFESILLNKYNKIYNRKPKGNTIIPIKPIISHLFHKQFKHRYAPNLYNRFTA